MEPFPIDRPDRRQTPQPYSECPEWDDEDDDNWDGNDWGTLDGVSILRSLRQQHTRVRSSRGDASPGARLLP